MDMRSKLFPKPAQQPPVQSNIDLLWQKATPIPYFDPNDIRADSQGNPIKKSEYGNRNSPLGWEEDHIVPVARNGADNPANTQPLQWRGNVRKADNLTIEDILRGRVR